jgi:hypothetical protein
MFNCLHMIGRWYRTIQEQDCATENKEYFGGIP